MQPTNNRKAIAAVVILAAVAIGVFVFFKLTAKKEVVTPVKTAEVVKGPVYKVIGQSVQDRKIESYTYGTGDKHIVFVGGMHGGYEWNSVLLAYQLKEYLDQNPDEVQANESVTIIPDINPDAVFAVTGKEGNFLVADVSTDSKVLAAARFNADKVDLNRNFDCKWQPKSTWQKKTVSAGTAAFSEPEVAAFRDFILQNKPDAVVFWHSQANAVYASQCEKGILPATLDLMNTYSEASGYPAVKTFDAYATTGAADDWLASINVPAVTVELKSHDTIEWAKNLSGVKAVLKSFGTAK